MFSFSLSPGARLFVSCPSVHLTWACFFQEIEKIVEVPTPVEVPFYVEKRVEVIQPVYVDTPVEVECMIEVLVPVEVEKKVEVQIIKKVQRVVEVIPLILSESTLCLACVPELAALWFSSFPPFLVLKPHLT